MLAKTRKIFLLLKQYAKYITLTFNVICLILFLGTYLSWYVSPISTTLFAYLGLAFPALLVLNILFILVWFVTLNWKIGLTLLIIIALCFDPIFSYFPVNLKSKEVPDDCIKIMTYNVRGFSHQARGNALDNNVIKYINESKADIICMQEFVFHGDNEEIINQKFKKVFPDYPYFTLIDLRPHLKGVIYGIACISKFPIQSSTKVPIKADANGAGMFKIDINGNPTTLIVCHLQSNKLSAEEKKMYKNFLKDTDTESLDSVTTSITSRLGTAYRERATQVEIINNLLANEQPETLIICGDFNDAPNSYTYKQMKGDLQDSFRENGLGVGITFSENFFWFRIDYILHSRNITSYNCTVDKVKYSDHYPVWTYLRFNDKDRK